MTWGGTLQELLRQYLAVGPDHSARRRAQTVFDGLLRASSALSIATGRLVVVRGDAIPGALSLPDGTVVLFTGAVRLCDEHGGAAADSLLAFVLAHELSHLASGHHRHAAPFEGVHLLEHRANDVPDTVIQSLRLELGDAKASANRERSADREGLHLAALAGHDAVAIAAAARGFFETWAQQTGDGTTAGGDDFERRAAAIRAALEVLRDALDLFELGTRYLELGRYADASWLLRRYAGQLSAPEAYNNLGLALLGLALARMDAAPERARRDGRRGESRGRRADPYAAGRYSARRGRDLALRRQASRARRRHRRCGAGTGQRPLIGAAV